MPLRGAPHSPWPGTAARIRTCAHALCPLNAAPSAAGQSPVEAACLAHRPRPTMGPCSPGSPGPCRRPATAMPCGGHPPRGAKGAAVQSPAVDPGPRRPRRPRRPNAPEAPTAATAPPIEPGKRPNAPEAAPAGRGYWRPREAPCGSGARGARRARAGPRLGARGPDARPGACRRGRVCQLAHAPPPWPAGPLATARPAGGGWRRARRTGATRGQGRDATPGGRRSSRERWPRGRGEAGNFGTSATRAGLWG